ncbi:hypothetical protein KJ068_06985 [bacterium]|nr:hypothetical protein [bacterium]
MDTAEKNAHWAKNLLVQLTTDKWGEIDVTALSTRDLGEVARCFRVSEWRNPFQMIRRFNKLMQLADVSMERGMAFYDSLDFVALAQRVNDGYRTIHKFHFIIDILQKICKSRVVPSPAKQFCDSLDFGVLGRQVNNVAWSMSLAARFMKWTRDAGAGKHALKSFCEGLDYEALGKRVDPRRTGISRLRSFLSLSKAAGVRKSKLQVFCNTLDLRILGQRVNEEQTGVTTVLSFVWFLWKIGVTNDKIGEFISSVDWHAFGQRSVNERGMLRQPLRLFDLFVAFDWMSKKNAREFVRGVGWENMRREYANFPPDVTAAAMMFLELKCGYSWKDLSYKGIITSHKTWVRSFTTNSLNDEMGKALIRPRQHYFNYALKPLSTCLAKRLFGKDFDLKAWNVLTYNLNYIGRRHVDTILAPIFREFPASKFEGLFRKADLRNISTFLGRFNSHTGVFRWQLPDGIDFKKINFGQNLVQSSLPEISFFLFSFFYINRADCAHFFAEELNKYRSLLLQLIERADLKTVDWFLWNWCLAMAKGERPLLIADQEFHRKVFAKVGGEDAAQEHLLGIIGTMHLFGCSVPQFFLDVIDIERARRDCQRVSARGEVGMFQLFAGLIAVLRGKLSPYEKRMYSRSIRKCEEKLKVSIPSQKDLLSRLKSWLYVK